MFIANLTAEAFETLINDGYAVVIDQPSVCSNLDPETMIESIEQGEIPNCEITEAMILNGRRMLIYVHHLSDNGEESACCSWYQVAFERIA